MLGLLGLAVAALAGAAALQWRGLLEVYHLVELRRDPGQFEAMLLGGGSKEDAARQFLREPEGKQALFRLYLAEYDRGSSGFNFSTDLLRRAQEGNVTHGSLVLWENGCSSKTCTDTKGQSSFSVSNLPQDPRRREVILGLLGACVGWTFRIPELPGIEFQIQSSKGGKADPPAWPQDPAPEVSIFGLPTPPEAAQHVCHFRVLKK